MHIRIMKLEDIPACAEILCSVYNNELWKCRWSKEKAVEYLTDFYHSQKFLGYVLEEKDAVFGAIFAHEKVWWNNSEMFVEEMFRRGSYEEKSCKVTCCSGFNWRSCFGSKNK